MIKKENSNPSTHSYLREYHRSSRLGEQLNRSKLYEPPDETDDISERLRSINGFIVDQRSDSSYAYKSQMMWIGPQIHNKIVEMVYDTLYKPIHTRPQRSACFDHWNVYKILRGVFI